MNPASQTTFELSSRRLVIALTLSVSVLSVLHLVTQWMRYHTGLTGLYGLIDLVALQREGNLPTFFASSQMLLAALLLGWISVIARDRGDRFATHWLCLALVFLLLAMDESASIHELTIVPLHDLLKDKASGLLYWPWVLPGMAFVIFLGTAYLRWFFALNATIRRIFACSALLFLGGALAIEMAEARHVETHGSDNFGYALFVWFEETFELAGVLVFIHGLLRHLENLGGGIRLTVSGSPQCIAAGGSDESKPLSSETSGNHR